MLTISGHQEINIIVNTDSFDLIWVYTNVMWAIILTNFIATYSLV